MPAGFSVSAVSAGSVSDSAAGWVSGSSVEVSTGSCRASVPFSSGRSFGFSRPAACFFRLSFPVFVCLTSSLEEGDVSTEGSVPAPADSRTVPAGSSYCPADSGTSPDASQPAAKDSSRAPIRGRDSAFNRISSVGPEPQPIQPIKTIQPTANPQRFPLWNIRLFPPSGVFWHIPLPSEEIILHLPEKGIWFLLFRLETGIYC